MTVTPCQEQWLASGVDPFRERLLAKGAPNLDDLLQLLPRPAGEPAFDAEIIAGNIARLKTSPEIDTGHPFLDLSVKTGLAFIDATFQGDHPKYGTQGYAKAEHDTFPPVIIAAVDALSAWGVHARAKQLFTHWLTHFIKADGTIDYYGPSVSEYGQILHTAALLEERGGAENWWPDCFSALDRMAEHLLSEHADAVKRDAQCPLISGAPEADECDQIARYFHNNGWVVKGLRRWADLCERSKATPASSVATVRAVAGKLAQDTLHALLKTWPANPDEWWLPPEVEPVERPQYATATKVSSYTNYRYWPELLSSGLLPHDLANRVVESRLTAGGQFCGMTRFMKWLDDWPLADYLYGLWDLGRKNDFLLSLYGHVACHQAEGHLSAYEQVTLPPGKPGAPYCLPCQLTAARAARLLIRR